MPDKTPPATGGQNRRENFRIDNVLPITVRKIHSRVVPQAHIFPVAVNNPAAGAWEGGLNSSLGEFDSNFALMLIEVNAKLDLLLDAKNLQSATSDLSPTKLTLNQLLLQINLKLEHLLSASQLNRPDDRIRMEPVSLSASGIKLCTEESLAPDDLVEVRMLLNVNTPIWVVVSGSVIRASKLPNGKREVAINFSAMDEAVSDEISRYALMQQKKQIQARRGYQR